MNQKLNKNTEKVKPCRSWKRSGRSIPPRAYDKAYLLSDSVEGYQEFKKGTLSHIKTKLLHLLAPAAHEHLLEVGIGRGEFLLHAAPSGIKITGIDYSKDVIEIARSTLREFSNARLLVADARQLPFDADAFDKVFAGDVIEHLNFDDGVVMLQEMYRVLKSGGLMLVHTAPNRNFTRLVYPWAKHILQLINKAAAADLDQHLQVGREYHIYEYNLLSLKKAARKAGLTGAQIWLDPDILRSGKHRLTQSLSSNPIMAFLARAGKFPPLRTLLGNDLYLKCLK